jgi:hypothetical protein
MAISKAEVLALVNAFPGELKIALFINTFHTFLPDSAPISFT